MTERTPVHRLQVATELHRFIEDQVLPGTGVEPAAFWQGFDQIVHDLAPKNAALLAEPDAGFYAYEAFRRLVKIAAGPVFRHRMRPYLEPRPAPVH